MSNKSSTGLAENIAGLLCYAGIWVTGIIFLVIEKENKTVRFHALQSTIWFGALSIISAVLGWLPVIGWIFPVISLVSWIYLMFCAYSDKKFKIPVLGDVVEQQINK